MEINHGYKAEIPPQIIFEKMKNCSFDFFHKNKILNLNLITNDYLSTRKSIINLMKKISDRLGFKSQTFFLSIHYFDIIKSESNDPSLFNNYYSLALSCLVISSKYCENDPYVPQLTYFIRAYNNIVENKNKNTIGLSDLIYYEVKICKILNYRLQYYTIYDYNSFLFGHGILKFEQIKGIKKDNNVSFSVYAKKILEKIYKKSRNYLDIVIYKKESFIYNSLLISIYIMKKSIESVFINELAKINNDNDDNEKEKLKNQSYKYFKEIMNEFYKINFESMEEYKLMKKDFEPLKFRNIINNSLSLNINNNLKKDLTLDKINIFNLDNSKKIFSSYKNNDNNANFLNNSFNYSKYNKVISEKNKSSIKLSSDEIKDEKFGFLKKGKNNLYYSINYIINKKNNNNKNKNMNLEEKKTLSLSKYYNNIQSENNFLYYNNHTSNLTSSINLNNHIYRNIFINEVDDNITNLKSISPNNNDNQTSKLTYIIRKPKKINKFGNIKIMQKEENNINMNNEEIIRTNDRLKKINKLYFKKFLYNNGEKKKINHKMKKNNTLNIYNYTNSGKNLTEIFDIGNLKLKIDENNYLCDKKYINNFTTLNNINIDNEKENNKNINAVQDISKEKIRINKRNINLNNKEKNTSYNKNRLNILSSNINPILKYESLNTENNYYDSYIGKLKQILKTKDSENFINLNRENKNRRKKIYTKTENNEDINLTSIKDKNTISIKQKSSLIEQKKPNLKINILKTDTNKSNLDGKIINKEYKIIKFLGDNLNINRNLYSYNNKIKKIINTKTEEVKNKNKLIIKNNIKKNFNKFDNEINSFTNNNYLAKSLNINSDYKKNIIKKKPNYKKCKKFTIDEPINNNLNLNMEKCYSLTTSNNDQNQKLLNKNDIIINNKNIYSTIVINNHISINLNKDSKENIKLMKNSNNALNSFFRNRENKIIKKADIYHKTTEKLNNKILKRIKNNK